MLANLSGINCMVCKQHFFRMEDGVVRVYASEGGKI